MDRDVEFHFFRARAEEDMAASASTDRAASAHAALAALHRDRLRRLSGRNFLTLVAGEA